MPQLWQGLCEKAVGQWHN